MSARSLFALISSGALLWALPVAANPNPAHQALGTEQSDVLPEDEPATAQDHDEYDEFNEYDEYEEADFCGGDDEYTVLEDAYEHYYAEELELAEATIAGALRNGDVRPWQRVDALVLLGESQLRQGRARPAAINFQRAIELDPHAAGIVTRVALSTALFRMGRSSSARTTALDALEQACATQGTEVACYGAHHIAAQTSESATERATHVEASHRIEVSHELLESAFRAYRELIGAHGAAGESPVPERANAEAGSSDNGLVAG